jgi:hypothetical protein
MKPDINPVLLRHTVTESCFLQETLSHLHRIRMQRIEMFRMRAQLLHSARTEGIPGGDEYPMAILIQPECDLHAYDAIMQLHRSNGAYLG